jgi:4-amino-4-deoxy-L-arabinose transferase-like glycosyltransferase
MVALGLNLIGLGLAPFADPPEGFHAEVARQMRARHDWITPRVNGVRYFDIPPLPYWLMSASFAALGETPFAARLGPALAGVAVAALTARLGVVLGGARVGLLAGLMVAASPGMFLYGRIVKPDLVFVLWLTLAYAGFAIAYRGGGRLGLALFYASLGLAALTKDILGALGPLAVVALFFWLTRERPLAPWFPWWGVLLAAGIALPWYLAVEAGSHGFLWYTIVDNHLLSLTRQRLFPDEDVPLSSLEFLAATLLAFLPWALALPWALVRSFRRPWADATARLWLLWALWAMAVIVFFTLSPFKLPHHGLPAFPALALLVARVWDESIEGVPGSAEPRALLAPLLVLFVLAAAVLAGALVGVLGIPAEALAILDDTTRNLVARGHAVPPPPVDAWRPLALRGAVIFAAAAAALGFAVWRRSAALGAAVALALTIAFLSTVAGEGMTQFIRSRSALPVVAALTARARPGDLVVHEGAIENSASALMRLPRPVRVVGGLRSNLAFGSTFPEARDVFWDLARLQAAWGAPGRHFLLSTVPPERSIVGSLPEGSARLVTSAGGRWLYSNLADRAASIDDKGL